MNRFIAFIIGLALLTTSCSSTKVVTDYDKTADFSKYETFSYYKWQDDISKLINQFDQQRLRAAVRTEMEQRGYRYVEEGGELVVALFLVLEDKTARTAYTDYYGGAGWGYGAWGWGGGYSTTRYSEYDYTQGTLVVDVFDAANKSLIWEAVAAGEVDENPNNREKRIPKLMERMFTGYPKPKP